MQTNPRIAIVGAGSLSGKQIYPRLARAGGQLVAVCDLDETKARDRARQYGGQVYTDLDRMLEQEELDGVIVCVGPGFHPVAAEKVMRAGLPVYTEKPAAETAQGVLALHQVQQETGQLYMCAFKKRYAAAYRRAKAFIESGDFGQPSLLSMFKSFGPSKNTTPRNDFLLDFCIHGIDLAVFLFGEVETVYTVSPEKNCYAVALRFRNGAAGSLSFSGHRKGRAEEAIELSGEDSWMSIVDSAAWRIYTHNTISEIHDANFVTAGADGGKVSGHQTELDVFIRAIGGEATEIVSDAWSCYQSMRVYEAIRDSADRGEVVRIAAQHGS